MTIERNSIQTLERIVGNREAIGFTLTDIDGTAINLTGLTLTFRMVNIETGTVKVNNQSATIVTAASGTGKYSPTADDVDTAGTYAMYVNDNSSPARRWPYDGAVWLLHLKSETDQ